MNHLKRPRFWLALTAALVLIVVVQCARADLSDYPTISIHFCHDQPIAWGITDKSGVLYIENDPAGSLAEMLGRAESKLMRLQREGKAATGTPHVQITAIGGECGGFSA